jgi:NADH:ubiquinone reductase (non-electrogenic)
MSFRVFARRAIAATACAGVGAAAYPFVSAPFPRALQESSNASPRERLVVLGSGWGAVALLKNIDPTLYDVSVVSPRNFFLNTPLLPGVTVGTVEARSLIEPVRALLPGKPGDASFFEAAAIAVDPVARTVRCKDESEITAANPEFTLPYDKLVVAVGAPPNTFGTPGVREHAKFLKEVDDAIDIRRKLADLFETASLPGVPEEEQRKMLSVLVVGGGPTGVEFAAELHDFLREDVPRLYPALRDKISITVVQSADHILNTYDARISKYAEEKFKRDGIRILTNRRVTDVSQAHASVMCKKTKLKEKIPFGVCVWSTGLGTAPLVRSIIAAAGQPPRRRAVSVDKYLQVRGLEPRGSVLALGDCADVKSKAAAGGELLDKADELFKRADVDKNGTVDKDEFVNILGTLEESYPQIATLTKGAADGMLHDILSKFDEDGDGSLDRREFRRAMAEADSRLASHPATAQVANQQGEYLARELNAQGRARRAGVEDPAPTRPFEYVHLGSFATLGGEQAALDTSGSPLPGDFVSQGIGTMVLWYGVYFSNCVSWRNKAMVVLDWTKKGVWGRDSSRV